MMTDQDGHGDAPPRTVSPFAPRGELATLVRERDWSHTPLGAAETWPQSLRTAVNILLTSRYAMWMGWGDTLTFLYNDAYRPTLGIKHPWALGSPASEVWAEIWADVYQRIRVVLSDGESTYDEGLLLILERSGFPEETYHTFSYSPLADDEGRVGGMFCVVAEETERVISERRMTTLRDLASALAASASESDLFVATEAQLRANPKDLPFVAVYLFDAQGEARLACATGIMAGHPAAPAHIPAGVASSWPIYEVFHHGATRVIEDLSHWHKLEPLPKGAWDKPPEQVALVPIKQAQERPAGFLLCGLNPYRRLDSAYNGFINLIAGQLAAGVANARAYEEERRRAEVLAELDRAKTAFFSNVSHEFRTPLTLMLGPIEDIINKPEDQVYPENRELLSIVQRNGLRLQRLVNTLLDFSRIEAGRTQASYEATDLAAYTAELASSFRSAVERAGLALQLEFPALPEPVYVDRTMWEKVVLNLISNAFKYTLAGSITVRLTGQDGLVQLMVIDTGTGIPAHELPRVFDRFHRAEQTRGRTHEGTGIGLALVQELVKLHGGTVSAQSVLGEGSTFTVRLPLGSAHLPPDRIVAARDLSAAPLHSEIYAQEALHWHGDDTGESEPPTGIAAAPRGEVSRSHVLLADDNADMRDYVCRLLSEKYDVTAVPNGEEALAAAIANPPDLVLSDVMMPVLDGFGLLRALREHGNTRAIPVILLSARAGEEASVEGLEAGADDYLVKPFSARELMARVGAHLALKRERQRAHQFLTQVLSEAPVGIAVLRGREFIVELANPSFQAFLQGRELVGQRFGDVVPEIGAEVWEAFHRVLDTGEPFVASDFPIPYDQDGDGVPEDHWFNVVYHPWREASGVVTGLIAVCSEVTVQVRARQELQRANRELEEFAYVASHDLQEPLRMVNSYTQLLLRRHVVTGTEEAETFAEYIRQGVRRMEQLIRDLLSYSRVLHRDEQLPVRSNSVANLNTAWRDALTVMQGRIAELQADVSSDELPTVAGEAGQFTHVFQNLISNALKYRRTEVTPQVRARLERRGSQWLITVEDNGIGFEPQYAKRIFGLFKRLYRDEYPGTGLGLAICQRIVERSNGRIWAESKPGVGSKFMISLPALD